MKRLFFTIMMLTCISFISFAQLNIKSTNSVSERFYKDTWATVTWNGNAFMFNSSDPTTALTLSFTLGKDKSQALTTLNQINDWFQSAENKASITFEDNGNDITLYKQDGLQIIISTGDQEFIRKEYTRRLSGAIVGTRQYSKKESTPHFSFILKKALTNSIETISALSDPKYLGENPEEDAAYQAAMAQEKKKAEYEQKLLELRPKIASLKEEIKAAKEAKDKEKEKELKQQLKEVQDEYNGIVQYLNPEQY